MDSSQEMVNYIFEEFFRIAEVEGIIITGMDQETGAIYIPNAEGQTLSVRLDNLIDYYFNTQDENAVADFVAKIKAMTLPQEDPAWEEAKKKIFISLYPNQSEVRSPYAKDITPWFNKFYVLDTPVQMQWILPELAEKWGVTEDDLEKQAMENADRLLAETEIEIGDVDGQGHLLGSFRVQDRNLTAACLFAPKMKEKLSEKFGWPLYVVFPDKITCYFFGKDHFDYFEPRIGGMVTDHYEGARAITPELLEFSDDGIKTLCTWSKQDGYVVKFDVEE
jgi:hypothetical protein